MISDIIAKAEKGYPIGSKEIYELMSITDKDETEELFAAARRVRNKMFGKKIYTYGFVYFSTQVGMQPYSRSLISPVSTT